MPDYETRETWKNDSETQVSQPLRQYEPTSLEEVVEIVKEAERRGLQVRAIGSGHSWSDVGITTDILVKPTGLTRVLDLDSSLLNERVDASTLIHVESGATVRQLNATLEARGLAFANLGGYDAQTIAGVISTSTHGSGIEFGPLNDIVQSLEIVAAGGQVYRIEPSGGITDPAKFATRYPDRKLVQDDDWYNAVVVSMGCMGVIYSCVLRVTQKFWLKEVRTLSTWAKVKEDLRKGDVLRDNDHWEVLVNPHKIGGENRCLITSRNRTDPPAKGLPADKLARNFLSEFLASLPFVPKLLRLVFKIIPRIQDDAINEVMEGLRDDSYINVSYKVFNIGVANEIPALSAEIGFPLEDGVYLDAVDRFLEMADENKRLGRLYHTAPVSLRFVKASPAFMSMMYGHDTCMMEIILAKGTQGAYELYERYENELYKFSGRPHWGQINSLTGSHDLIRSMYPMYDCWIEVYHKLNPTGTFDSPFTKRIGLSSKQFTSTP